MTKSNKVGAILSFVLSFAIFLGGGIFCSLYFGNSHIHAQNQGESLETQSEYGDGTIIKETYVSLGVNCRYLFKCNTTQIADITINNDYNRIDAGQPFYYWGGFDSQREGGLFTITLKNGCSWKTTTSYEFDMKVAYRTSSGGVSEGIFENPTTTATYDLEYSDQEFRRSGNDFYWDERLTSTGGFMYRVCASNTQKLVVYIDLTGLQINGGITPSPTTASERLLAYNDKIYAQTIVVYDQSVINYATIQNFSSTFQGGFIIVQWGTTSSSTPAQFTLNSKYNYTSTTSFNFKIYCSRNSVDYLYFSQEQNVDPTAGRAFDSGTDCTFTRTGDVFKMTSSTRYYTGYDTEPTSKTYLTFVIDITGANIVDITSPKTNVTWWNSKIFTVPTTMIQFRVMFSYTPTYINNLDVGSFTFSPQGNGSLAFSNEVFTATLASGASWKAASFTFNDYYQVATGSVDPSSHTSSPWTGRSSTLSPITRSGDVFNSSGAINISAISGSLTNNQVATFVIDVPSSTIANQGLVSVAKPTHSGSTSHTYTGNQITHGVTGYETTYMTRSGTYQATNAGNYSITYTLKSGYCWNDSSTSPVVLNWSITQATNSWTSQPSISSWTYGSAPSNINVGTPQFGGSSYIWGVVNADVFETYYVVDTLGYSGFSVSALDTYLASDWESYPMIGMKRVDGATGNVQWGYDFTEDENVTAWAQLPAGRYYFYSWVGASSINYTRVEKFIEFYIYAPTPTITNTTFTYNGNNQGPTISGSTTYYSTYGTTTAKNAGSYGFYIQAKYGTDTSSGYTYPYYFNGHGDMDYFLNDWGYNNLAECYSGEGWSRNVYYAYIVDYLGSNWFAVNFVINKASLDGGTITLNPTDYTYDGTVHKP